MTGCYRPVSNNGNRVFDWLDKFKLRYGLKGKGEAKEIRRHAKLLRWRDNERALIEGLEKLKARKAKIEEELRLMREKIYKLDSSG